MMKQLFNIRIPSFIGILLLLIGVGVTSYLVDQGIIFEGRAAPEKKPLNIAITNVSPTGFTVMYTTDDQVPGTLKYGTEKTGTNVAADDREKQTGQTVASNLHHITVENLKPATTYYFSILSGDAVFQNGDQPYEIKTAPELSEPPKEVPPITGSLTYPEGAESEEALLLITSEDSQPLSTLVGADGSYTLPATGVRSKDLSSFADLQDGTLFDLVALSSDETSVVTVLFSNTRPIPLIMLGQAYDFTISTEPLEESPTASGSADIAYPDVDESAAGEEEAIQILSPEEEETFTDQQPVFTGTALPGEEISVVINSEHQITATIEADTDGSWEFRPTEPLEPGEHTITIKTRDITGTLREFTRSFTVFAQGSQFVEPSVSPTRSPTPTISASSPTPTLSPTKIPTPTTQITRVVTPTPTVTPVLMTSPSPTRPPLEATGTKEVVMGGVIGITTVIAGFILFFLMKGSTL